MSEPSPLGSDTESYGGAEPSVRAPDVKLSTLAVVACGLAILSFLLLPGFFWTSRKFPPVSSFVQHCHHGMVLGSSILAAILGLISVVGIATSGGRLTGRAFAWIGVSAPVVQFLLFLLLILPTLPRSIAFRMTCGTNVSGIGKAMLIYANDYEDEFPRAGGRQSPWAARIPSWTASDRYTAYGVRPGTDEGGGASISASLYLLVKYAEVMPERFVCKGDEGVTEFRLAKVRGLPKGFELIDAWDFGPEPPKHVSYAYHVPYGNHALTNTSEPGLAVLAERNPWMASPFAQARDFALFTPDIEPFNGTTQAALRGNALAHQGHGQSVLFVDSHVEFAKRAYCAMEDDNIYTSRDGADKVRGKPATFGSVPGGPTDSLLVNDPAVVQDN